MYGLYVIYSGTIQCACGVCGDLVVCPGNVIIRTIYLYRSQDMVGYVVQNNIGDSRALELHSSSVVGVLPVLSTLLF